MKKLIPILTIALAAVFAAPAAEARGYHKRSYVAYHRTCGGPAWVETYVAYYDHCGHPVFRKRVVPVRHRVRYRRPAPPVCHDSVRVRRPVRRGHVEVHYHGRR